MTKSSPSKTELNDFSAKFLEELVEKSYQFVLHLDTQTNILVGVSSAIFLFSISRFLEVTQDLTFLILAVFSAISALVGLFAIHPPRFMRKRGQEESLMYHKHIVGFRSPKEYAQKLLKVIGDKKLVTEEFATEIYNVSKYYYRPKRKLFHLARNLLLLGILASAAAFVAQL